MIRSIACGVIILGVTGFAFTSSAGNNGKASLAGADTEQLKIKIRSVDQGEILWDNDYQLHTHYDLNPGRHVVSVLCEFGPAHDARRLPGQLSLDLQPNTTYRLSGRPSSDGKSCGISVTR